MGEVCVFCPIFADGKTPCTDWSAASGERVIFMDRFTCGVWVGFDKPRPIKPGGYGGALALPIWVDIIEAAKR
jgi:membrane carboxypeptidase/penicillin-binding protein